MGGLVSMIQPLAQEPNVACSAAFPNHPAASREALNTTAKDQGDPELNEIAIERMNELVRTLESR